MRFSVIPKPNNVSFQEGLFPLNGGIRIVGNCNIVTERILAAFLKDFTKLYRDESNEKTLRFILSEAYEKEAYKLTISNNLIEIEGASVLGHQNAIMTLGQLMASNETLTGVIVKDCPRYVYRGFMLDVSRHFIPLEEVKKLLEIAALYKFNSMHWHLTDDQGWRVEIKKYPLLTEKGAKRKHSLVSSQREEVGFPNNEFYTQEEISEIVKFAAERNIEIIPEIDMPGHVTSALHAYPELSCHKREIEVSTKSGIHRDILCAGNEATYEFIFNILDEVIALFPGRYIHIGGDEVPKQNWFTCPVCREAIKRNGIKTGQGLQTWFTNRCIKYLEEKNKEVILWNDSLTDMEIASTAMCQYWNSFGEAKEVKKAIEEKHRVIDSNFKKYYLDYPYSVIPLETTYHYESIFEGKTADDKLMGIECTIWTEMIPNKNILYKQLFPRFMAVAEAGWTNSTEKDYTSFLERLSNQERLLSSYEISLPDQSEYKVNGLKRLLRTLKHYNKMISWDTLRVIREIKLERLIAFDEVGNLIVLKKSRKRSKPNREK